MGSGFGDRYGIRPNMMWIVTYKENGKLRTVQVEACYARHEGDTISFYDTHGNLIEAYGQVIRVKWWGNEPRRRPEARRKMR